MIATFRGGIEIPLERFSNLQEQKIGYLVFIYLRSLATLSSRYNAMLITKAA